MTGRMARVSFVPTGTAVKYLISEWIRAKFRGRERERHREPVRSSQSNGRVSAGGITHPRNTRAEGARSLSGCAAETARENDGEPPSRAPATSAARFNYTLQTHDMSKSYTSYRLCHLLKVSSRAPCTRNSVEHTQSSLHYIRLRRASLSRGCRRENNSPFLL